MDEHHTGLTKVAEVCKVSGEKVRENVIFIRTCIPYFSNPLLVVARASYRWNTLSPEHDWTVANMRFSSSLVPSQGEAQQQEYSDVMAAVPSPNSLSLSVSMNEPNLWLGMYQFL